MSNSIIGSMGDMLINNSAISPAMIKQFKQFKNSFHGNPQQRVMQMLQSGQINNTQLQQVMAMARQLQGVLR